MKKYTLFIICTLLTGLLFTTCEPWIVPEAVFVNFNANGGQGDMKALRFMDGEKQALTKNTYTRNGYIFDGWNTMSDGRGQSYTDRQNVTITKSVTLYAQWTKIYKVHFNANGGTGTMAAQTFVAGVSQAIAANAFTRSGYTFTGWNTNADGSGTSYTDRQSITLTNGMTLYAQWGGTENGYQWVDLGLPSGTKWATCNVGATTPEGYGSYFAWGETSPKNNYDWTTYKYCNGSPNTLTKYNNESVLGTVDRKSTLEFSDDAARVNWGGKWRMPTKAEIQELGNSCTWTSTTRNGVKGYKVTSKTNGNDIFLPATGYWVGVSLSDHVGYFGYYWTNSLFNDPLNAVILVGSDATGETGCNRALGLTVRAVFKDSDKPSTFLTVTFIANGGTGTMAAQAFEAGVSQALAANKFTRDGYTFAGWTSSANGSGPSYTDMQTITLKQNMMLYAKWKKDIVNYTITFNANGGTGTMAAQTFEAGVSQAIAANAFTRSGYTFTGWNTKADGSGTSYTDKQSITLSQNITLYAQWKKDIVNYTVTFNANGGTGTMAAQTFVAGVSQTIAANTFTRSGYTFTGWNTNADGSGTSYTDKQSITLSQDITLYAQWKKDIVNYTVTFNANGGTGTMAAQTFEAGVSHAIAANAFTRSGYTFTGWNTKADGSGTSYTDKQSITISQNITLYAQWYQEQVVSGTENGHDYVDLGLSVKWATCNVGAATPDGYGDYFAWGETEPKTNYDFSTYKYCNGSSNTMTKYCTKSSYGYNGFTDGKTTLDLIDDAARANWGGTWRMPTEAEQNELRNNCTWTWTTQNGVNGYKVTSKTNGNSIFLPAAGGRIGTSVYDVVGSAGNYWSSSLDEKYPYYACYLSSRSDMVYLSSYFRISGNSVRAVFSDNDKPSTFVTLTFNANGGTGTMAAQTFEAGVSQAIAANAFTRSGYTFTGWNTKADGSGTSYTDKQSITISQDITLYAQWKKDIVNYTVTFNANGGSGTMAAQTFEAGVSQAIAANTFTRDGHMFTGWNTAPDGSGTPFNDQAEVMIGGDLTLYAQWYQEQVVSGTENGYDYVDLGLPSGLKWATCNVGATKPDGYGDYFAWGETAPKTDYDWSTYKHSEGANMVLTKYNTESEAGIVDNKTTLELSDDAAHVNWGGKWRMPTRAEQEELVNNCTRTMITQNGVYGCKVTSKTNGNSIFLPAAGSKVGTILRHAGYSYYWSRSLRDCDFAYCLDLRSDKSEGGERIHGYTVRAVCP